MGWTDKITGGSESKKEIDHYELRVMAPGEGRWKVPEFDHDLGDLSGLREPLDEDAVRATAETEGWPSGKYKLQGRFKDGTMAPTQWTFDHDGPDQGDAQEELTPEEEIREEIRSLRREFREASRPPEDLEGKLMHTMDRFESGDIDEETVGASMAMYEDVSRLVRMQGGDILDHIAWKKLDEGDLDGAARYQLAKRAAESKGGGGLLQQAMDGNVDLDGEIGIKELIYLDAYHEFGDELRELLRTQTGAYDQPNQQLERLLADTAPDQAAEADESADAEIEEEPPAPESGAEFDLAPGVTVDDEADVAAESGPAPQDDAQAAEPVEADDDATAAVESGQDAAADGGDEAAGVDALDEAVDTEAGEIPSLADASVAIQEENADDDADEDNGGED